jgi:hypothetical protein
MGDSPVMLSAAKHLSADRDRPFAALRVTVEGPMGDGIVMLSPFASLRVNSAKHLAA